MASACQNCGETDKAKFVCEITGQRLKDVGPAHVAGVQLKRQVRPIAQATLTCQSCKTSWNGIVEDEYFYPDLIQNGANL